MRILLAEDERDLSRALVTIFTRNNYSVDAVFDGQAAIEYLETGLYDCAVLDVMMPKVDGIQVLRTVRERGDGIPVLLLTAKAELGDKITGLDSGADDYLTKPFAVQELLARIRAITRRGGEVPENVLCFEDLKLDRATCELTGKSGSFKLANKEFQMMEMLMDHPGKVISSERFMEKIWGYDSEAEINVVWVYVSYLRKKLTALDVNAEIKASRGLGYFLDKKK